MGDLLAHADGGNSFVWRRTIPQVISIEGAIAVTARMLEGDLFQVAVHVVNRTPLECPEKFSRDEMLPYSLAAAHTILAARDGEFVSLLDPPERTAESGFGMSKHRDMAGAGG